MTYITSEGSGEHLASYPVGISGFFLKRKLSDRDSDRSRPSATKVKVRFVAFPATEYDEVFSGYQPGQMVER
jgi:hypothetical protein